MTPMTATSPLTALGLPPVPAAEIHEHTESAARAASPAIERVPLTVEAFATEASAKAVLAEALRQYGGALVLISALLTAGLNMLSMSLVLLKTLSSLPQAASLRR